MKQKLPYYMAYPMPLIYDDARIERMDFEYMKSLYPEIPKKLLPYVEEECDRMEYANSMMYDEYPDKFMLHQLCRQIRTQVEGETAAQGVPDSLMDDLIQVLLCQEISRRRCRRRRNYGLYR